ncbi:MAG: hypothetical protein CMN98_10360 [Synechococcus sp. NP17]|nr:hypothetical protein [Synechococcus sp. NP17]|tara:strand:+ start:4092 stop:4565 length:474 start_codon:yes stop_codon:yes gene_type:complete
MNFDILNARESAVRLEGTGLKGSDLMGCWQLQTVWSKGSQTANPFNSWMLRSLDARLEIEEGSGEDGHDLHLCNAVNLGPIELKFQGPGSLKGKRPLLVFHFDSVMLRIAGVVMLNKKLAVPPANRAPFFALIERNPDGWLAARGRGGGLALWTLKD